MAAHRHRFFLGEAGLDHVHQSCSPQIVIERFWNSSSLTSRLPRLLKVKDLFAFSLRR
jgi:hypothetical protein